MDLVYVIISCCIIVLLVGYTRIWRKEKQLKKVRKRVEEELELHEQVISERMLGIQQMKKELDEDLNLLKQSKEWKTLSVKYFTSPSDVTKFSTIKQMDKFIHKQLVNRLANKIDDECKDMQKSYISESGETCYSITILVKKP